MDRLKIENSEVENFYKSKLTQEFKRPGTLIFVSGLVFEWYPWIQKGLPPVFSLVLGDLNYFARMGESWLDLTECRSENTNVFEGDSPDLVSISLTRAK